MSLLKIKIKKLSRWVKPWVSCCNLMGISLNLFKEWVTEDGDVMKNHLQFSKAQFEELLLKVKPLIEKKRQL